MNGRRQSFTDITARRSFSTNQLNIAPGPGSYRSPSDFGQYDEKKDMRASTSYSNNRMKNMSKNTDRTKYSNNGEA